jgi:hypothetical protein
MTLNSNKDGRVIGDDRFGEWHFSRILPLHHRSAEQGYTLVKQSRRMPKRADSVYSSSQDR